MKTDRLLSIVIYLLNHDTVTAAALAERFEVSRRTILRDIEQISLAGIPIKSLSGPNGGYSIMEGYKLEGRLLNEEEQASIFTALKGFSSAYDSNKYNEVLEKISSVLPKRKQQHVFLDFGASGDDEGLQHKLKQVETAIVNKNTINISYVNALGDSSTRLVEPIALNYRWYSWYLLAYCTLKQDYRIFKMARIGELEYAQKAFSKEHEKPDVLLEQAFKDGKRKGFYINLYCKASVKVQINEYLGGTIMEVFKSGDFMLQTYVMEDERMWFGMLLSFGDKVRVLEPVDLQERVVSVAKNIISMYE